MLEVRARAMAKPSRNQLHDAMNEHLSNDDLPLLCIRLREADSRLVGLQVEDLPSPAGKSQRIISLIDYFQKRNALPILISALQRDYPYVLENMPGEAPSATSASPFDAYRDFVLRAYGYIPLLPFYQVQPPLMPIGDTYYVALEAAYRHGDLIAKAKREEALKEMRFSITSLEDYQTMRERLDEYYRLENAGLTPGQEAVPLNRAVATYPRLVVLGEPGAGKTTLLQYLTHTFAQAEPEGQVPGFGHYRLPINVRLADFASFEYVINSDTIAELAARGIGAGLAHQVKTELLEWVFDRKQAIILLDGLDEVDPNKRGWVEKQLNDLATPLGVNGSKPTAMPLDQHPVGNRIIITCRIAGYERSRLDAAHAHYVVLGVRTKSRRGFLLQWFESYRTHVLPESVETGWAEIEAAPLNQRLNRPGIERVAQIPLFLSLIAQLWLLDPSQQFTTRAAILRRVMSLYLRQRIHGRPERETDREFADEREEIGRLARLAYCVHATSERGGIREAEGSRIIGSELWRQALKVANLLVERGYEGGEVIPEARRYGFPHRIFEEYLAARYLVDGRASSEQLSLLRRHLHDERWQEVVLLALGTMKNGGEMLDKLCISPERKPSPDEKLLHRDLLFALEAAADGVQLSSYALSRLVDETSTLYFADDCNHGKGRYLLLREQIEARLERLVGTESGREFVNAMRAKLKATDPHVRSLAIMVLGRVGVGDESLAVVLIERLKDRDNRVRDAAAEALGRLGVASDEVLNTLVAVLYKEGGDDGARSSAMEALARLGRGNRDLTADLLQRLDSEIDDFFRYAATRVVGEIGVGEPAVVASLLDKLQRDDDTTVRREAADALGNMGANNEQVINGLLAALRGDIEARYQAARALAKIGAEDKRVPTALFVQLRTERDFGVLLFTALAIGSLEPNGEVAIPALVNALPKCDSLARGGIVSALGRVSSQQEEAVAKLLQMLRGERDMQVQVEIMAALGNLGVVSADTLQVLKNGLGDSHDDVRKNAAISLGKIAAKDAVSDLITRLGVEPKAHVRREIVRSLGILAPGDKDVSKKLLAQVMSDPDYIVSGVGVIALKSCLDHEGVITAIRKLTTALHDAKTFGPLWEQAYNAAYEVLSSYITKTTVASAYDQDCE